MLSIVIAIAALAAHSRESIAVCTVSIMAQTQAIAWPSEWSGAVSLHWQPADNNAVRALNTCIRSGRRQGDIRAHGGGETQRARSESAGRGAFSALVLTRGSGGPARHALVDRLQVVQERQRTVAVRVHRVAEKCLHGAMKQDQSDATLLKAYAPLPHQKPATPTRQPTFISASKRSLP